MFWPGGAGGDVLTQEPTSPSLIYAVEYTHWGTIDSCQPVEPQEAAGTRWDRCTCRGRCKGHAKRPFAEREAEIDLEDDEPWPPPYPRPYKEDFRAPLDVPLDHPTRKAEEELRRRRIIALNRAMKAREDELWRTYAAPMRLQRLLELRHDALARRGLEAMVEAAKREAPVSLA